MRIGRTTLVVAFVFGIFAGPFSADAQQPTKVPLLGILSDESPALGATSFEPLAQGLRDLGWVEGQNITFEPRRAAGDNGVLAHLASELVRLRPDVNPRCRYTGDAGG
jgi:putative ABC transport system substrate-binding protein